MTLEDIAKIAHQVNSAYCLSLNDGSQVNWDAAPEWQKASAIAGVKFHLATPHATPRDSHKSWLALKFKEGWKWGPVKDAEKKEHPCYCDYDELPQEQKSKDFIFKGVVEACREFLE